MSNFICKACDRKYKTMGPALTHVERVHQIAPYDAMDALWSRGITAEGFYSAETRRDYELAKAQGR